MRRADWRSERDRERRGRGFNEYNKFGVTKTGRGYTPFLGGYIPSEKGKKVFFTREKVYTFRVFCKQSRIQIY